jgi:hypothetical protein
MPPPPEKEEGQKRSTFSSLFPKKKSQEDDIYMMPPAPPGGSNAENGTGGGDRIQSAVVRKSLTVPADKEAELTDAMFEAPAGDDLLEGLAGGGGGGGGEGEGNEEEAQQDGSESDGVGTGSESDESEAEGEFKGGKGDTLTSRYLIEKEVGRGTFGRVLRCIDTKAASPEHEKVAIKVREDGSRPTYMLWMHVCC